MDKKDLKDNPYWRDCADDELTFAIEGLAVDTGPKLEGIRRRASLLEQFDRAVATSTTRAGPSTSTDSTSVRLNAGHVGGDSPRAGYPPGAGPGARSLRPPPLRPVDPGGAPLVEAGVRFVTVHYDACDGYGWDSHVHSDDVKDHLLPTFDQALSALLIDLNERGLLAETLVVAVGEMGRTPIASPRWGRGHWSTLFPAVLAAGASRAASSYGGSDKDAAQPIDHPVLPERLAATIYHALGIDPQMRRDRSPGPAGPDR